jgi:hypothetical protein
VGGKEGFGVGVKAGAKVRGKVTGQGGRAGRGNNPNGNGSRIRENNWRGGGREKGTDPAGHIGGKRGMGGWVSGGIGKGHVYCVIIFLNYLFRRNETPL